MGLIRGSLLDIPMWNQNGDPLPQGGEDPQHASDCGEECASMRIFYRTGIDLPAGILRLLIPGKADTGATTGMDLVILMRRFLLKPVALATPTSAVQMAATKAIRAGIPPILLGHWLDPVVLHWVLGVDADKLGITVNDPWGGARRMITWDLVAEQYAGLLIS